MYRQIINIMFKAVVLISAYTLNIRIIGGALQNPNRKPTEQTCVWKKKTISVLFHHCIAWPDPQAKEKK